MTVASEITRIEGNISAAYTAADAKGATIPATENSDNLATCIASISSGYTEFPSYQVVNGVASRQSKTLTYTGTEFSDITSISTKGLHQAFAECNLSGYLRFANLITINQEGLNQTFANCRLSSVSFPKLKTINERGLYYTFYGNTSLTDVSFSALDTITNEGLNGCFVGCTNLGDIYFWSLTSSSFSTGSDQFKNMLLTTGTAKQHELHFPSGLQSTIQNLSGYPNFGGTSGYVTIAYDL